MYTVDIQSLATQYPVTGELLWIGLRPSRKQSVLTVEEVTADTEEGLIGDHYAGTGKKRQVTLFQWEHLAVVESFLGKTVTPEMLRRNLLVRGINLLSLKKQTFQIGDAVFVYTGLCHPCSRMEAALGPGGYNALRSHGGITAKVMQSGRIKTGDAVKVLTEGFDSRMAEY